MLGIPSVEDACKSGATRIDKPCTRATTFEVLLEMRRPGRRCERRSSQQEVARIPGIDPTDRIALSHCLNANLVHKWRREARRSLATTLEESPPAFIPVPVAPVAAPAALAEIHIELRRGPLTVKVSWPTSAMAERAGWLRELLR